MITKEQLADACRAHDNAADTGTTLPEALSKRGVETNAAVYVADQRALRMVLGMRGEASTASRRVMLSQEEEKLMMRFAAMWLDGLVVGLKCGGK